VYVILYDIISAELLEPEEDLTGVVVEEDEALQMELYYFDLRLHVLVPAVPYVSVLFPTLFVYHVQLFQIQSKFS
jgi:hypothetical protein